MCAPGMELSCNGGVHLKVLLAPEKGSADIDAIRGSVQYKGTPGDSDGVTNAVENLLGTRPDVFSAGLTKIVASTGILVFEQSQSNSPATDLQSAYEWSIDLQHWNENGASFGGTLVSFSAATLVDLAAPANDQIRVTATATGVVPSRLFARLRVTQTGQ